MMFEQVCSDFLREIWEGSSVRAPANMNRRQEVLRGDKRENKKEEFRKVR